MTEALVFDAIRTPRGKGKVNGSLHSTKPVDLVVVRENNEGLYTGSGGFVFKGTPHEIAVQESINTRRGVERCLRYAFEFTRKRNKDKKLTL